MTSDSRLQKRLSPLLVSARLLSVQASQGTCSGTGTLLCDLGSMITDTTARLGVMNLYLHGVGAVPRSI